MSEKFVEFVYVVGAGSGDAFVPWLAALKARIGIPTGLGATGVQAQQIPELVAIAEKDICHKTNPRPCTAADFTRFFEQAM